ncbi:MAG: hypothetical protein LQ337_001430 [Flavoplaca oasis]|nr:MAG: hypothetical protein LQ337_001430 [Flavoplaca oasis]
MLSFTHRKSSSSSQVKVDNLIESPKEKASHHITSKADPTKAINEAQPDAQAREQSTLENIRLLQHRDPDPDRSNPTRPRLERPLDTIRAFEAAIDGSYERGTPSRADTSDGMNGQSRRSSTYLGQRPQPRLAPDTSAGYYGNRMSMAKPESTYVDTNGANISQPGVGRRFNNRANSDPLMFVASASGNESHNTDPWSAAMSTSAIYGRFYRQDVCHGNSTDPSSENSSIDRIQHGPKPEPAETYGFNGFGGGPILEEHGMNDRVYDISTYYGHPQKLGNGFPSHSQNAAPPPPPHASTKPNTPKVPIKLGNSPTKEKPPPNINTEKRRSWLKRRFSRT